MPIEYSYIIQYTTPGTLAEVYGVQSEIWPYSEGYEVTPSTFGLPEVQMFPSAQIYSAPYVDEIKITQQPKASLVAIARNDADIALYGYYDHIEEVSDIHDPVALQALADQLLEQLQIIPTMITVETDNMGCEPGQILSVSANGVTGDFLIESVSISERYNDLPTAIIVASSASQRNGSVYAQQQRLLSRSRSPVDRTTSDVAFVVAETIEGYTNPGLSVGLKSATRTYAKEFGYLKQCRLMFNSAATGTLTTNLIEIDILQNGTSVFGSRKMLFPAGSTREQVQLIFASNPKRVDRGDIFTINVIAADASAKDGWLHLQIQG